mgnify:FL=1
MKYVNAPVMKKDAMALVTGKPVYMDDLAPKDCLIVKVLRSPYAHALIEEIKTENALKQNGIECILTYKDVPKRRFTMAGQSFPEPSPYDRYILDQRVRFVGDAVAIVAGTDEAAIDRALKMIKVKYQVLEPVLDYHTAKDNPILVHPEEDWKSLCPVGADNKRNLCASGLEGSGDVDAVMDNCEIVMEETFHVKAVQQAMMETFRTTTYMDTYGRLNILSSTQIPFHVRRILANALDIPKSRIRVIKPRIGGGFGAKQTVVAEVYPAIVTMLTGKPAKIIFTRKESLIASSPRHEMEVTVKLGADSTGKIHALDVYTLSNTGAFGEHGPTTVGLSGHKSIPLYQTDAFRFRYDVVYTNHMSAGAYRGYGATQGIFAVESMVNRLADRLHMDPSEIRYMNMTHEGDVMPAYYGETANSCKLEECLKKASEMIGWQDKPLRRVMPDGKIRGLGMALAMQGSAISNLDVGSVTIKLSDEGFYNVIIGCTDMGTGCDTIIAQFVADTLETDIDNIAVYGVDTDTSPYDSGSYASSTTYLTGMAAVKAAELLKEKMFELASKKLSVDASSLEFDGKRIFCVEQEKEISLFDLATASMANNEIALEVTYSHSSPVSPPPFMAACAEVEVDPLTGSIELLDYAACVDCGTVVNTNLARVQTEGGLLQGIGMTLYEDIWYNEKGVNLSNSFMQYKIPTRLDFDRIRVEFESSYEPTGPYGAKSIGEIVINTPAPAIAHAIHNATDVWFNELPITPEKILKGMHVI